MERVNGHARFRVASMKGTAPNAPAITPCAMLADLEARLDLLAQLLTRKDHDDPDEATDTGHQPTT